MRPFAFAGLILLISIGGMYILRQPQSQSRLRLRWHRHRLMVGKIISLVSLVSLLGSTLIVVPVVQAVPEAAPLLGPVQAPWAKCRHRQHHPCRHGR